MLDPVLLRRAWRERELVLEVGAQGRDVRLLQSGAPRGRECERTPLATGEPGQAALDGRQHALRLPHTRCFPGRSVGSSSALFLVCSP
jgi:hypothetical protein